MTERRCKIHKNDEEDYNCRDCVFDIMNGAEEARKKNPDYYTPYEY